MVDSLEHSDLCLWNSGHHPSADDLFWDRACHRLLDFGRGNWTFVFCIRYAQRRRLSVADTSESALRDSGNLFIGEPAFGRSLTEPFRGDFSPFGRHIGINSLLSSPAIPPLGLATARWHRQFDPWDIDDQPVATSFSGDNWSVDRY